MKSVRRGEENENGSRVMGKKKKMTNRETAGRWAKKCVCVCEINLVEQSV